MGGDFAPREVVAGAVAAAEEFGLQIILVGAEKAVRKELSRLNYHGNSIFLLDAPEMINMGDGVMSLRRKENPLFSWELSWSGKVKLRPLFPWVIPQLSPISQKRSWAVWRE